MRQSMRDRIARLERTIQEPELVISFAPWVRRRLKFLGRTPSSLFYQTPAQAPHSPARAEPEPEPDVLGGFIVEAARRRREEGLRRPRPGSAAGGEPADGEGVRG
jgi:hypothetical protein